MGEQESRHQLQKGEEEEMLACAAIDAAVRWRRRAGLDALASSCARGQGRQRSASGQLNLDLPGAGPAGQDPPSIAKERRPPPSGGARRVLACRESSARSTHGSKQKMLVKVVAGKRPMPVMPMSHACRRPCRDPRTSPHPIVLRHDIALACPRCQRERERPGTPMGNGEMRGVEQRQCDTGLPLSVRHISTTIDTKEPRELEIR
jgi:hypothetical protein